MREYYQLTKPGIVKLVLLTGIVGYGMGFTIGELFQPYHFILFSIGLTLLSAGSLSLNQAQEWSLDAKMPRTQNRPIPSGKISLKKAYFFGISLVLIGELFLFLVEPLTAFLGLATVILYNVIYTLLLKRVSYLAAVPGAIPGAAPVVLGYTAIKPELTDAECVYAFLLMFLWQMPHFWALAIRFKNDYELGGFPVLPSLIGNLRTKQHIGIYLIPYLCLAISSKWYLEVNIFYYILVLPVAALVFLEFIRFYFSKDNKRWIHFFLWANLSVVCFLIAPVLDKWVDFFRSQQ